jgi:hypothetical protein
MYLNKTHRTDAPHRSQSTTYTTAYCTCIWRGRTVQPFESMCSLYSNKSGLTRRTHQIGIKLDTNLRILLDCHKSSQRWFCKAIIVFKLSLWQSLVKVILERRRFTWIFSDRKVAWEVRKETGKMLTGIGVRPRNTIETLVKKNTAFIDRKTRR